MRSRNSVSRERFAGRHPGARRRLREGRTHSRTITGRYRTAFIYSYHRRCHSNNRPCHVDSGPLRHARAAYGDGHTNTDRPTTSRHACVGNKGRRACAAPQPRQGRHLGPAQRWDGDGLCAGRHLSDGGGRE